MKFKLTLHKEVEINLDDDEHGEDWSRNLLEYFDGQSEPISGERLSSAIHEIISDDITASIDADFGGIGASDIKVELPEDATFDPSEYGEPGDEDEETA